NGPVVSESDTNVMVAAPETAARYVAPKSIDIASRERAALAEVTPKAKPSNGAANTNGTASNGSAEKPSAPASLPTTDGSQTDQFARFQIDAPSCDNCGSITVRNGNCYLCHNCGNSMGCS
ncbi:MAG: vitamin B12-dependent ribonucleotide reductase, partial [Planctomycetota bacterium]